jgi:DNA polymerase III subunit delta
MIITITGSNRFLMKRRMDELVADFLKQANELALERIDGAEAEPQAIFEAVQGLPFLASKKMVVIRELSANKVAADKIEQIISTAEPTTDVIFYEPEPDRRTSFYKCLRTKTQLEEYENLDGRQLAKWLMEEAKKRDGNLIPAVANYLVDRVGANQALLYNELEKLLIYDPQISKENIDLLVEKTPQSKIFDLLDATFSGNKKRALELYEEQRAQKVEPQALLALLAWQLQILALAKYGEGKTAGQIAKDAKLNPYPVSKAQGLVRKIPDEKLKQMIHEALEIDYRSKTSAYDIDEALKTYIVSL